MRFWLLLPTFFALGGYLTSGMSLLENGNRKGIYDITVAIIAVICLMVYFVTGLLSSDKDKK
ncbi:MAG: hypothetical protein PHQ22_10850 [Sulfuricurvum sp.]|nr:hypothetical protein [Sulfuricurvum sp.]